MAFIFFLISQQFLQNFGRQPYSERLIFHLIYTTEQSGVLGGARNQTHLLKKILNNYKKNSLFFSIRVKEKTFHARIRFSCYKKLGLFIINTINTILITKNLLWIRQSGCLLNDFIYNNEYNKEYFDIQRYLNLRVPTNGFF